MSVAAQEMLRWCQVLLNVDGARPDRSLAEYLAEIPRLESLADLPSGTCVLVRGDVDAKPGATVGEGDIRLRSMRETLQFGRDRGWKQIVFGHKGRKPEESLAKVAARLGEILQCDVTLVTDWLDESTMTIRDAVRDQIVGSSAGAILMLENARRYEIERSLWKAKAADLPKLAEPLARLADEFAAKVATVYVHEALSAGSLDASSTVVPAAMRRVALGAYEAAEFAGPMMRCLATQLVVFSGLKADKLDDLEAMIGRGTVKTVFAAGSLAMALKKAAAVLDGSRFSLGIAEDPAHADKPYYIPPARIEQAKRMIATGRQKGIEFILPIDFVLQDGRVCTTISSGDQQLDVGPATSALFEQKIGEFIAASQGRQAVAFHNGVFGKFEDPQFAEGTRRFIPQLQRLKTAGFEVYVGGGEGGTALEQFGALDDVTHCFTAGGTVLNALGNEPVPYLVALAMAADRAKP
ncbi:MAG: phosphoglycerate kinase [Pirellulales bacterium]